MRKAKKEYAVYKGEEFVDLGTIDYLAKKLGTTKKTLLWYAGSKRYNSKQHERGYTVIALEDEDEEENI